MDSSTRRLLLLSPPSPPARCNVSPPLYWFLRPTVRWWPDALLQSKAGSSVKLGEFKDTESQGEKERAPKDDGGGEDLDAGEEDENENEDNEEHEEGKLRWRAKTELATYDAGDEEDQEAAAGPDGSGETDSSDEEGGGDTPTAPRSKAPPPKTRKSKEEGDGMVMAAAVAAGDFTCSTTITLPLDAPKLLMLDIAERVAADTFVRATPVSPNPLPLPRRSNGKNAGPPGCLEGKGAPHEPPLPLVPVILVAERRRLSPGH